MSEIFKNFVKQSPITVLVRALLERVLSREKLDSLFEQTAQVQYTRELLFSTVVSLMMSVVCDLHPSINSAYKAKKKEVGVSKQSVYNKINGLELGVSASLIRYSARELEPILGQINGQLPALVPGYRVKILDGNSIGATEHRIDILRTTSAGPLPGKSLVVLDPALMLAIDFFPCEDGYTQERSLLKEVLETVEPGDLWIADRNMCTQSFLLGIFHKQAAFIIRQHKSLPWEKLDELRPLGRVEGGEVFEQLVRLTYEGETLRLRRVVVLLDKPTRNGETEIVLLTNLPELVADGLLIAQLYRKRWKIETLFQTVTQEFNCEIKTLGYPKAALFSFCMALFAYNIFSTMLAAIRSAKGLQIEANISQYYLSEEVEKTYRGMMIAIPSSDWEIFEKMPLEDFCKLLLKWAHNVDIIAFLSSKRGPKKNQPKRTRDPKHTHVSTARLLAKAKKSQV